jgi:hypothetical protein
LRHLAAERVEHAAIVLEQIPHAPGRGAAHLAVVHPERPFRMRHEDLGIREGRLAVGREKAVHVVAASGG